MTFIEVFIGMSVIAGCVLGATAGAAYGPIGGVLGAVLGGPTGFVVSVVVLMTGVGMLSLAERYRPQRPPLSQDEIARQRRRARTLRRCIGATAILVMGSTLAVTVYAAVVGRFPLGSILPGAVMLSVYCWIGWTMLSPENSSAHVAQNEEPPNSG